MIKNENNNQADLSSVIRVLFKICNQLNNLLPETQQVEINTSMQSISEGLQKIADKIVTAMHAYQKIIQNLQDNLRKHIKNQIQLKLYYEHLEDVIMSLKKQKNQTAQTINSLKTQLTVMKQKQKNFMTVSNNNTRNNQDLANIQSKLDTITKIKNRLSLNATQQFYANYLTKKIDKDHDTKQLREKRESLANTLKQLYQSPIERKIERKQKSKPKEKDKDKDKSKDKQKEKEKQREREREREREKEKDRSRSNPKNRPVLNRSKSGKSLNNSDGFHRNTNKSNEKQQKLKNVKQKKEQKDYLKTAFNYITSRRNSKS